MACVFPTDLYTVLLGVTFLNMSVICEDIIHVVTYENQMKKTQYVSASQIPDWSILYIPSLATISVIENPHSKWSLMAPVFSF